MKRKTYAGLLAAMLLFSVGCAQTPNDAPDEPPTGGSSLPVDTPQEPIRGVVSEVSGTSLTLLVDEENWAYRSADTIVVHIADAVLTDVEGKAVTADAITPNCAVSVAPIGGIAESYPAQVTASAVQLLPQQHPGMIAQIREEYPSPQFLATPGAMFAIGNYPDREGLSAERFYLIDGCIGEIVYASDISDDVTLRAGWEDVGFILQEYNPTVTEHLMKHTLFDTEFTVTTYHSDYNVVARWKNGFAFSLVLMNCSLGDALPVIEEIATSISVAVT